MANNRAQAPQAPTTSTHGGSAHITYASGTVHGDWEGMVRAQERLARETNDYEQAGLTGAAAPQPSRERDRVLNYAASRQC